MADRYSVKVKDFGPIVDAAVEVRPLTVFVGPSNTGKSYLAVLIYALHRSLGPDFPGVYSYRSALRPLRRRHPLPIDPPDDATRKSVSEWARQQQLGPVTHLELPRELRDYVHGTLERAEALQSAAATEVGRCFGVDKLGDLVRGAGSAGRSHVGIRIGRGDAPIAYDFPLAHDNCAGAASAQLHGLELHLRELTRGGLDLPRLVRDGKRRHGELDYFLASLVEDAFRSVLGPIAKPAYYLPADRTGVMHSHKVVVGALLQGAATAGLRPSAEVPMLSGVLVDFLDQLIAISDLPRAGRKRKEEELAAAVEKNVLHGAIRVDAGSVGYPTFTYRPRDWKQDLPLLRASSMVSELAPVVLYLRHLVRPGDVLIIEEPEAHLHPAMQAAFARELARLVRAGIRIVMTTHSEWLLEQIGNLVRLSSLPAKKQAIIGGADVALSPEDVGAWFFSPSRRPKGSTVREVKLDPETGLYPTDYDLVGEALYNESANIFNHGQDDLAQ